MQNPLPELDQMVQPPSDLLERPNSYEPSLTDTSEFPSDDAEQNTFLFDSARDDEETPSDLLMIPSNESDIPSDLFLTPSSPEESPREVPSVPSVSPVTPSIVNSPPTTNSKERGVVTCDKSDLEDIKTYFPSTSFKNVSELCIYIVKNWRLIFEVDQVESQYVKSQAKVNELKDRVVELESISSTQKAHIANLEAQLANIVPTQAQQPLAGISNEEHEAIIKAKEEIFKKKVTEIATKVQEEAENRLFNAISVASLEALEEVYKQLLADHKGHILTAFTSKLMTREEFFNFFQRKLQGGIQNHLAL